jgi:hypothetical protein
MAAPFVITTAQAKAEAQKIKGLKNHNRVSENFALIHS